MTLARIIARHLRRNPGYVVLNVACLSLGVTAAVLLFSYIQYEQSYDAYQPHADRIFRVVGSMQSDDDSKSYASTPFPLAEAVKAELNEEVSTVRLFRFRFGDYPIRYGDKTFSESNFFTTDSSFFRVFHHDFVRGSAEHAFDKLNSLVITESVARRYFGDADPVGKTMVLLNRNIEMEVTGVVKDPPGNSHLKFNFLLFRKMTSEEWSFRAAWTYILLPPSVKPQRVEAILPVLASRHFKPHEKVRLWLQPLTAIHLSSGLDDEPGPNNSREFIQALKPVAFALIAISMINFAILSFAHGVARRKELSVRKIVGANRRDIMVRQLSEALTIGILSAGISLIIVLSGKNFLSSFLHVPVEVFANPVTLAINCVGATLCAGVSGILPAIYFSLSKPALSVSRMMEVSLRRLSLVKVLVGVQFVVATVFILSATAIYHQMDFIRTQNKGINYDQIVLLNVPWQLRDYARFPIHVFAERLRKESGVESITSTTQIPWRELEFEPFKNPETHNSVFQSMHVIFADEHFGQTFDLDVLKGRHLLKSFYRDPDSTIVFECMVNETAVKVLSLGDDPVGKELDFNYNGNSNYKAIITAVVRDFNFQPVYSPIKPVVMVSNFPSSRASSFGYMALKVRTSDLQGMIGGVQSLWNEFSGGWPLEYHFMNDAYIDLYRNEADFSSTAIFFSVLISAISLIGLFAVTAIVSVQKLREMAVRKIFGAGLGSLYLLMVRDFLKLSVISGIIAVPIAFLYFGKWLERFAFRTELDYRMFAVPVASLLILIFVTTLGHVMKSILVNPLKIIKND